MKKKKKTKKKKYPKKEKNTQRKEKNVSKDHILSLFTILIPEWG